MTIGCPKPLPREKKPRRWLPRSTKPIARSPLKRSTTPIPLRNERRMARRAKEYRAHLASKYWQELRQRAYQRDQGLCWCPVCITGRANGVADAFESIEIFVRRGKVMGFDTHHTTYARFGAELLSDVLTMRPAHHRALEARSGIRKGFLSGKFAKAS